MIIKMIELSYVEKKLFAKMYESDFIKLDPSRYSFHMRDYPALKATEV